MIGIPPDNIGSGDVHRHSHPSMGMRQSIQTSVTCTILKEAAA
jgi:hypothetical protein